jgi:hypothetical protein
MNIKEQFIIELPSSEVDISSRAVIKCSRDFYKIYVEDKFRDGGWKEQYKIAIYKQELAAFVDGLVKFNKLINF